MQLLKQIYIASSCLSSFGSIVLITFAGTPPTIVSGGTSRVTTAPAATTAQSPTVTPGSIVEFEPTHTLFPSFIGA